MRRFAILQGGKRMEIVVTLRVQPTAPASQLGK
jgi:hypothetical protein